MTAEPITREAFAALVSDLRGELAGVDEKRRAALFKVPRRAVPEAWRGRDWAKDYVGVAGVMELTGYARNTVVLYNRQARAARAKGETTITYNFGGPPHQRRLMPPPLGEGRQQQWMIGELALWVAVRDDRQATSTSTGPSPGSREELITKVQDMYERDGTITADGITRELDLKPGGRVAAQLIHDAGLESASPNAHSAAREQILDAARIAVSRCGAGAGVSEVTAVLVQAGVKAGPKRIRPELARARLERIRAAAEPAADGQGAELESLRTDGLVTGTQIARAFGVTPGAVTKAQQLGNIRPATWEPFGKGLRALYDPRRLTVRADGGSGPVDIGSEHATGIKLD